MRQPFPWFKAEEKKFHSVQSSKPRKGEALTVNDVLALEAT
ncbi:MAG: hypothetical protein ACFFED_05450 [Candidatus Thorarchaeota archaeon]